jgi:hypothetical protein
MSAAGSDRYRVARLDDIEAIPISGSVSWRPVRGILGVGAFGVACFSATNPGQDLIEPHTESEDGRGHQELYVVLRGAARFTLDKESFDAPAGTLVFVQDPTVHRHAVATEPQAEVLALGGEPGFRPAGDEWMWRVRHLLPDRIESAREVVMQGLAEAPDSPGLWYARALLAAAQDDDKHAVRLMEEAIALEPTLLREAQREELFAHLLEHVGRDVAL